jgi:uroporphyrin-III C-methyltransferase
MNDELVKKEVNPKSQNLTQPSSKAGFNIGVCLVLLFLLIAIAISVTTYLEQSKTRDSLDGISPALVQSDANVTELKKESAITAQEVRKLQLSFEKSQKQLLNLEKNIDALVQQDNSGSGNDDWQLAEIKYLLLIASHRLRLETDVSMALSALQAADDRLKDNEDARLLLVREGIAKDMNALKAVNTVDIAGLSLFLSDLVDRVNQLPLQKAEVETETETNNTSVAVKKNTKWEQLKSSVWQEIKDLVIISRRGNETIATLMPEQKYFLFQNLRLQLESARYAVLRRDSYNLQVSIDIITNWLNDYFDIRDNGVANIIDSLTQMKSLELNPVLPNIGSLQVLRTHMDEKKLTSDIYMEPPPETEE